MKDVLKSIKLIFSKAGYIFITFLSAWLIIASVSILPNRGLLGIIWKSSYLNWPDKLIFFFKLSFNIFYNQGLFNNLFLPFVSLAFGMTVALLVYYTSRQIKIGKEAGLGLLGIIAGVIGVGCGACGSVAIASILGVGASAQLTGELPLKGLEFSIISLILLGVSFVFLSKKVNQPPVCKIE